MREDVDAFFWYYEDDPQSIVSVVETHQTGPRTNERYIPNKVSLVFDNVTLSDEGRYSIDVTLATGDNVSTYIDAIVVGK